MKNRASEDLLGKLHDAVARDLLRRVASGEASPAELNAAIKFLQNNGIEAVIEEGDAMSQLAVALPVFADEHEDENS